MDLASEEAYWDVHWGDARVYWVKYIFLSTLNMLTLGAHCEVDWVYKVVSGFYYISSAYWEGRVVWACYPPWAFDSMWADLYPFPGCSEDLSFSEILIKKSFEC